MAPVVLGMMVSSCGNNAGSPDTDDTTETEKKTPTEPQRPQSELFILDISGSMKGYLEGDREGQFRGVMAAFTEKMADMPTCYYYGTKIGEPLDKAAFKKKREERTIPWAGESNLKGMIETLLNSGSDINVLLTDGIMSGTDAQIKKEPEYNKQNGPGMASELSGLLAPYAGKRSALIVRYLSHFSGKYCYYDNSRKDINTMRPFFIIAVGDWAHIKWVEQYLREGKATGNPGSEFAYTDILMLGDSPSYTQHKLSIRENVEVVDKGKRYKAKRGHEREDMVFSLDLSALPDYMQNEEWIKQHAEVLIQKSNAVTPISFSRHTISVQNTPRGKLMLFALTPIHPKNQKIIFRIRYEMPQTWMTNLSCSDDKQPFTQGSTFNLNYLVQGFSALHSGKYVYEKELQL